MAAGTGIALQHAAVGALVVASTWTVLRHQFPMLAHRLRIALALPLVRDGRPRWMRALGLHIAPRGDNMATACGGCRGCAPPR